MNFLLLLLLCIPAWAQPITDQKQELVHKIIDLIKREQIRQNLIDEQENTTILNHENVLEELDEMFEENEIQDIEEAVEIVNEAVQHEPIFSKAELSDFNLIAEDLQELEEKQETAEETEEENTLEDVLVGVYEALPTDVQETIRDGVQTVMESYDNITLTMKREWYNFQINANELVNDLFGDGEEEEDYQVEKIDEEETNDGILRPGQSTITFFDVVQDFFEDLWDGFWNSRMSYLRIYKRSINKREVMLPELGTAGEIVNDMAQSFINTATVWKYKDTEGPECVQRLLCQSNRDIFSRGHVLPSVMTYISNLLMSIAMSEETKMSEMLLAAQNGRRGKVDCLQTYSKCRMKL